ncbi:helix-turn-helix domain-containing protein [Streptomyces kronopolitis]
MTEPAHRPGARHSTLAQKLDRLIAALTPAGGNPPSYNEIARSIDQAAGERVISPSYIWKLHKGEATNPRVSHLEALAAYFDVPVEYFLNDDIASHVDEQLRLLAALKTGAARNLALRANELSPESLRTLNDMMERLRTLEVQHEPRQSD